MKRSLLRAHPLTSALLAFSMVGVLVFGGAAGAQAAIWPKGFNPKQYMLNVLSSMLAGAAPDSKLGAVKRNVISQDQQFDHSWEALDELWKKDATKVPNTYQDYALQKQAYFSDNNIKGIQGQLGTPENTGKGTKYVKPMKAPATKVGSLVKKGVGAGVGVGASVGWAYRADLGTAVGGLFGVDAAAAYCSDRDQFGNLSDALDFVTGQDCDAWKIDTTYDPNLDAVPRPAGWQRWPVCWSYPDDHCWTVTPDLTNANSQTITTETHDKNPLGGYAWNLVCYNGEFFQTGEVENGTLITTDGLRWSSQLNCPSGYRAYGARIYSPGSVWAAWSKPTKTPPETSSSAVPNESGVWFSDESPAYIAGADKNPDRTFLCTYTMQDGTTQEKETDTFKETDDDVPSPVCPALDADEAPAVKNVSVDEVKKDDGTKQNVYSSDTTEQYQDWWQQYPECREGACALDLIQKSNNVSCFYDGTSTDACMDWMKDPDKTANYQCMYGGHKVDLTECYAYGDVFKPEKVLAGQAYTDPATGESVGGQSSPNAATKTLGRTWTDPQDFSGCLDTGWAAANPVEWVLTPIQCALQWGFAPSQQVVTTTTNAAQNGWASKGPGKITNAVAGWSFTAPSGCDIPVTVMGVEIDLADACPGGPMYGLSVLSKVATSAVFATIAFFACRRIIRGWINDNDGTDGGADL